uniref:Uncharacterized protein n=1 Tax=Arundo donax TaxID=35708 RepID=A0A0A8ZSS4_ARUDO
MTCIEANIHLLLCQQLSQKTNSADKTRRVQPMHQ